MRSRLLLALVPLALAAAACSSGSEEEGAGAGPDAAAERTLGTSEGEAGEAAQEIGGAREAGGDLAARPELPGLGPRVIQTASLEISVARGRFEAKVEEARTAVAGLGGFVTSSTASRERGRLVRGTLVVRVPARSYARAVSALSDLGRVEARRESGEDVSAEFVDVEARRRHLEAVEAQLLKLLQRAQSVTAALAVQARLNEVQLDLEQIRGRLRYLENQTEFATISLALRERGVAPAVRGAGGRLADAWRDAVHGFLFVAGRILVVLAWAAPVALLLGLVLLGVRLAARRPLVRLVPPKRSSGAS